VTADPADMLGPTVTVTPATYGPALAAADTCPKCYDEGPGGWRDCAACTSPTTEHAYPDIRRELLRRAADRNGPALARLAAPQAGEDLLRQCADAYRAIPGTVDLSYERLRAVVGVAVRLTEQRVRAEMRANMDAELVEANATITRAGLAVDMDHPAWLILDDYDGSMDNVKALVAETEQRVRAEYAAEVAAAASLLEMADAALADLLRRLELVEVDRDTLADRARVVDVSQLNEAGTRSLCNTCGHEQFTPASPLYGSLSAEQASVVPPDPNSPEGGSGGAA
jgi:hypothetical protein